MKRVLAACCETTCTMQYVALAVLVVNLSMLQKYFSVLVVQLVHSSCTYSIPFPPSMLGSMTNRRTMDQNLVWPEGIEFSLHSLALCISPLLIPQLRDDASAEPLRLIFSSPLN